MLRLDADSCIAIVNFVNINRTTRTVERITAKDYNFICSYDTVRKLRGKIFTHSRYSNYLILSDYQTGIPDNNAFRAGFEPYSGYDVEIEQKRVLIESEVKDIYDIDEFTWLMTEDLRSCSKLYSLVERAISKGECSMISKNDYKSLIETELEKSRLSKQSETSKEAVVTGTKKIDNEKGENKMNLMNNFEFGVYKNPSVKVSMQGLAVKDAAGKFISYKNGVSTDVTDFIMADFENGIMAMPVGIKKIKAGDIIVHAGKPMVVEAVNDNEGKKTISAIDIAASEVKTIIPIKNIFGFDFYTKLACVFDGTNIKADEDNPFGGDGMMLMMMMNSKGGDGKMDVNSMLPLMLMGEGMEGNNSMMKMMVLSNCMGGGKMDMNSLMPLMMMKGGLGDLF